MLTKLSYLSLAITAGILSVSAYAEELQNIEHIEVKGRTFNDYKVGSASGAMRGNISLMDTPQSVTVIPDFVTDEQLATNLSEVLVNDSSVTGGSEKWNRQVFNIRGFELSSGSGYLINGHQQWSHYVQPIETLQQVEVLKGPSSMLYGQSGPGGLINMVTKKPTYESQYEFGFDTDENGSTRFQLDAGGALNDSQTIRYRTVLVKQDTTYWREYQDGTNQERDRWLGYINLDFDLMDNLTLSVKYDHTQDKTGIDRGGWLDADGELMGGKDIIWDQPWAFTDNTISNLGADLTYYMTDAWSMKLGYNDQQFNRQRVDSSPSYNEDAMTDGYQISPFDRYDDWQHKTAFVDFNGQFSTGSIGHQMLIGANMLDYYYGQLRVSGEKVIVQPGQPISRPDIDYHDDDTLYESDYKHYGFYFQDLMTFNDHWQAIVGARYDEQKKDGDGNNSYAVSPKFGVVYSPAENGSIYVNYSKSFTPQGIVNDENDVNDKMNLDPEYGTQYEVGTKWEFYDGGLLLTGAIFDITVDNVTVTEDIDSVHTITTQSGEQRHKGAEIGAQGQLSEKWFMTGSMMYLDAEYIRPETDALNGKTPMDAPELSANIWTRYEVNDSFALNFGAIYVGERFANTDNTIVKDDYVRFDLGAAYTMDVMDSDVSIRMNVKNLFDVDYVAGGSYNDATVGDGRHVSLALEAKF
ncbi:TonB-dependent receptor [Shewanella gaetbuli]|uniref:TonB-dependent siderophore receptor n=1 Tax=Shewanella gaetbuli TaxID=220752 RepID=A0A9X2CL59_9GAMM|nr:TonB-dependent siderophore receptor [Shewanella gaetbuli]MCL1143821.1 TonB-dependent siderophore receptor [Shewanella gaetbuli]